MFDSIGIFFQKVGLVIGSATLAISNILGFTPVAEEVRQPEVVMEEVTIQESVASSTNNESKENTAEQQNISNTADTQVEKSQKSPVDTQETYTPQLAVSEPVSENIGSSSEKAIDEDLTDVEKLADFILTCDVLDDNPGEGELVEVELNIDWPTKELEIVWDHERNIVSGGKTKSPSFRFDSAGTKNITAKVTRTPDNLVKTTLCPVVVEEEIVEEPIHEVTTPEPQSVLLEVDATELKVHIQVHPVDKDTDNLLSVTGDVPAVKVSAPEEFELVRDTGSTVCGSNSSGNVMCRFFDYALKNGEKIPPVAEGGVYPFSVTIFDQTFDYEVHDGISENQVVSE